MRELKQIMCGLLAVCLLPLAGCEGTGGAPRVEQTNKQLLVHIAPYQGYLLNETIAAYKEQYPGVELIVEDSDDGDYGADAEAVRAELMGGKGPDIIFDPAYFFPDLEKTMGTGLFADLNIFFDADPAFKREDYYTQVMEAGRRKGRQYVMPLCYEVPLLLSTEKALAEAGVDRERCAESCLGLAAEVESYLKSGRKPKAYNSLYVGMYYPSFLGISFLDYEKKTADFSAPEFEQAAALYRAHYSQDITNPSDFLYSSTTDGYFCFTEHRAVFQPYTFGTAKVPVINASLISATGETPVIFPVRSPDGKSVTWINQSAAINANSANQQNAYEFLKLLLSESWQGEAYIGDAFPILRPALDSRIEQIREETNNGSMRMGADYDNALLPMPPLPEA